MSANSIQHSLVEFEEIYLLHFCLKAIKNKKKFYRLQYKYYESKNENRH